MRFRQSGHDQDQPTKLYVLECAGKVKIGIAADVAARVAHLQMACPVKIAVAHERMFPTRTQARLAERALHLKHAEVRLWGEWFEMEVLDAIAAVVAVEEQAAPVRIPTTPKARTPAPAPPPAPSKRLAKVPANDGTYRPTWDEYEAMSDEEWCDHMRPLAITLDFTLTDEERQEQVAAAEAELAAKYGNAAA